LNCQCRKKEIDELVMDAVEKRPPVDEDANDVVTKTENSKNKEEEIKEPAAKKKKPAEVECKYYSVFYCIIH